MGTFSLFHWLVVFVLLLVAPLFVLLSPRVTGYEKLGWVIVTVFSSWIGLAVFLIVTAGRPKLSNLE
ncbi:MAG TPA: hypothetical protein VIE67_05500 [Rudaea sp.]|jgi:lipopolysaccharide export LptBFGC system permease protein LptF|uniref:hypothetical protein n=1 Tax=Rudaea sp. TaxID=2136325 RepID=UPI002F93E739